MYLYWLTLLLGIILVIYALIKVGKQKDQASNNGKNMIETNSKLLLSEVIEELHENTENIVERFSKREEKLEMLIDQADKKIEELNYQLEKRPLYVRTDSANQKGANEKGANETSIDTKVLPFPAYQDKYSKIKEMYKKGQDITEIAKQTGKDKGEVQLILNLIKKSEEFNNNEMGC